MRLEARQDRGRLASARGLAPNTSRADDNEIRRSPSYLLCRRFKTRRFFDFFFLRFTRSGSLFLPASRFQRSYTSGSILPSTRSCANFRRCALDFIAMRYLLAWFPMIVIAVANGAAREAWLVPRWLSTMALIVLLGLYMSFVFRRWPLSSSAQAIAVGRDVARAYGCLRVWPRVVVRLELGADDGPVRPRRRAALVARSPLGRGRALYVFPAHSALIAASFTTRPHFSWSFLMRSMVLAGVMISVSQPVALI